MRLNYSPFFFIVIYLTTVGGVHSQNTDTLTIASYNLLKFPSAGGANRIDDFQVVVNAIQPDILVVQEIESQTAVTDFLTGAMNQGSITYQPSPFVDGPDTDSALFFNQDKVSLLDLNFFAGGVRYIMEYVVFAFGQELHIFSGHLKAGDTDSDEQARLNHAVLFRNYLNTLPANSNFIFIGDFNFYTADEPGFQKLTEDQSNNNGRLFDPINQLGNWHNNSFFIITHTQSTRTTAFGGGATGGLDDRFDLMLVSDAVRNGYGIDIIPGSYKAFGNDGNHFNLAINVGVNTAVPANVADALHQASDHLPLMADFVFGFPTSVAVKGETEIASFSLAQNFPNPFNPATQIRYGIDEPAKVNLSVYNIKGERVAVLIEKKQPAGEFTFEFNSEGLASGVYIYKLTANGRSLSKKFVVLR